MELNRAQALALLAGNGAALFLVVNYLIDEISKNGLGEISAAAAVLMCAQLWWVHTAYQALRYSDDAIRFKRSERVARIGFGVSVIGFAAVVLFYSLR